jgi:heme/copper-type cytochrome/quinol oxidase subunit 2
MMSHWFSNWVQNQKQTRRFHPSWILLVVVVTVIVAGIIWIFAALVTRAEQDDHPPAAKLPVRAEEAPATCIPWMLTRAGPKPAAGRFRYRNGSKQ